MGDGCGMENDCTKAAQPGSLLARVTHVEECCTTLQETVATNSAELSRVAKLVQHFELRLDEQLKSLAE